MNKNVLFIICLCYGIAIHSADISEDAKRHMFRGQAAMEDASDKQDYLNAIREFKKAVEYAPALAEGWFNLGVAEEAAEEYGEAINSFKKYLLVNPGASDKADVEARLYKLEYRAEQAHMAKIEAQAPKLDGIWRACDDKSCATGHYPNGYAKCGNIECTYCGTSDTYTLSTSGSRFELYRNSNVIGTANYKGTIDGDQITGEAIMDLTKMDVGKRVFTRIMNGNISDNGNRLTMNYQWVSHFDLQNYSMRCVFIRAN